MQQKGNLLEESLTSGSALRFVRRELLRVGVTAVATEAADLRPERVRRLPGQNEWRN